MLFLLLLTTSAWPCLQLSRNLGTTFLAELSDLLHFDGLGLLSLLLLLSFFAGPFNDAVLVHFLQRPLETPAKHKFSEREHFAYKIH